MLENFLEHFRGHTHLTVPHQQSFRTLRIDIDITLHTDFKPFTKPKW